MYKMKIFGIFLLTFIISPSLSGCWNSKEIEKMFYIQSVGIDYKDGRYEVYAQLVNFKNLSKESGGGGKESLTFVGKGVGENIDLAFHNLYKSTQRRLFWGHLSSIVFTEAGFKNGFQESIDLFSRYPETRYTVWIYTTRVPIQDVLTAYPIMETSTIFSRLGEPIDSFRQSSWIESIQMHKVIVSVDEPGKTAIIPEIKIGEKWKTQKEPHRSLMIDGVSMVKKGKINGWMEGDDLLGLRWFNKEVYRIPVKLIKDDIIIGTFIARKSNEKITHEVTDGKVKFNLHLKIEGNIINIKKDETLKGLQEMAEKEIKKEIGKTYQIALEKGNSDIYQLEDYLYRNDNNVWQKVNEDGYFLSKDSIEKITVDVTIKSALKNHLEPFLTK